MLLSSQIAQADQPQYTKKQKKESVIYNNNVCNRRKNEKFSLSLQHQIHKDGRYQSDKSSTCREEAHKQVACRTDGCQSDHRVEVVHQLFTTRPRQSIKNCRPIGG